MSAGTDRLSRLGAADALGDEGKFVPSAGVKSAWREEGKSIVTHAFQGAMPPRRVIANAQLDFAELVLL